MKVTYKKSILEKIRDAILEAIKLGKTIEHIELTEYEWKILIGIIDRDRLYDDKKIRIPHPHHIVSTTTGIRILHDYCYIDGILVYKEIQ